MLGATAGGRRLRDHLDFRLAAKRPETYCIDWKRPQTVWSVENPQRQFPFMPSAAVTDRTVVIGVHNKKIRAFAPDTGIVLWTFGAKGGVDSSATIVGDRVFVGASDGNLYELDLRTGHETWRYETGSAITASPAVAAGRLVIGTLDGVLYCFGASNAPKQQV